MKNLKKLRELHGISQQKLADELFVTQQSIYKYENGLAYPNLETLKMISQLFSVSIDYIVGNDRFIDSNSEQSSPLTPEEQILIRCYRKLSPDLKSALLNILKNLK